MELGLRYVNGAEREGLTTLHCIPLRPCGMRYADVMKVLRFAKLGSDSVSLRPGGVQNPPPDSVRNDLLATARVAFKPRFAFGSRGSRPSCSDSKKAPEWELFEWRNERDLNPR